MATRLFTIRADKMEIQYLKMVYAEMEKMLDHFDRKYEEEKDIEFHRAIARGSRNTRIITAIENLYQECFYLARIYRHERNKSFSEAEAPPYLLKAIKDHKSILDSISSGDPDAAEEAARKSVRSALHRLMNNFIELNRKSVIPEKPAKKAAGEYL
jgi:DNA-binding FadR family transcriptional regulator